MDTYQIVCNGVMLAMDREEVTTRFAALFKISTEKAAALLNKHKVVLRSNMDANTAETYREKLVAIGVDVEVRHVPAAKPVTAQAAAAAIGERYQKPAEAVALAVEPMEQTAVAKSGEEGGESYQGNRLLSFDFYGTGLEYFRVWIVNVFLTVLTLGVYSAWAKVRTQQYFYGNTQLGGASFQYLATPAQILRGRIVGVALLALYVGTQQISVQAGLIGLAVLLVLTPALLVMGLSARLSFTAWRHVRFSFQRSFREAYTLFALPLLFFAAMIAFGQFAENGGKPDVSIGLVIGVLALIWMVTLPYWVFAITRFMVSHARYGNQSFEFSSRPGQYYSLLYLKAPALFFLSMLVAVGISAALMAGDAQELLQALQVAADNPDAVVLPSGTAAYASLFLAGLVLIVGYLIVISYVQAQQFNLRYDGMLLGKSRLSCQVRAMPLLWLWLSNTVGIVLTGGLFIPWAKVRMAEYRLSCLELYASYDLSDIINDARQGNAIAQEIGDVFDVDIAL